jgi:hypothetical protein
LAASVVLIAALGVASPAFAQSTPSPDPDPQARPDPVTTRSDATPSPRPVTQTPVVRSAPQPVSSGSSRTTAAAASRSTSPRVIVHAKPAHITRHASRPHRTRARTVHAAAVAAWRRLAVPIFPRLTAAQADDRPRARELSLAAVALLLVVIAAGSLLRLTRDVQRGRPA